LRLRGRRYMVTAVELVFKIYVILVFFNLKTSKVKISGSIVLKT